MIILICHNLPTYVILPAFQLTIFEGSLISTHIIPTGHFFVFRQTPGFRVTAQALYHSPGLGYGGVALTAHFKLLRRKFADISR
jgi:hypothetical protein